MNKFKTEIEEYINNLKKQSNVFSDIKILLLSEERQSCICSVKVSTDSATTTFEEKRIEIKRDPETGILGFGYLVKNKQTPDQELRLKSLAEFVSNNKISNNKKTIYCINLKSDEDYTNKKLYSLHATKTNEKEVTLVNLDDTEVIFPAGSFVRGNTYQVNFKKLIFQEEFCSFVGYFEGVN